MESGDISNIYNAFTNQRTLPEFDDSRCKHNTAETSFLLNDGHFSPISTEQGESGSVILAAT